MALVHEKRHGPITYILPADSGEQVGRCQSYMEKKDRPIVYCVPANAKEQMGRSPLYVKKNIGPSPISYRLTPKNRWADVHVLQKRPWAHRLYDTGRFQRMYGPMSIVRGNRHGPIGYYLQAETKEWWADAHFLLNETWAQRLYYTGRSQRIDGPIAYMITADIDGPMAFLLL